MGEPQPGGDDGAAAARRDHWQRVYQSKPADTVSWYQPQAEPSLGWIRSIGLRTTSSIIDVGGGASVLVDALLADGYRTPCVLDISAAALEVSRARLGGAAAQVRWAETDVLSRPPPGGPYDLWHDRAVFHFLIEVTDRRRYVTQLRIALRPGGYLLLACFAADGPTRCSGLPVVRYDAATLAAEFAPDFLLLRHTLLDHRTPSGGTQRFLYSLLQHQPGLQPSLR